MAETRVVIQYRTFILQLNPVTGYCEESSLVAISEDYNRLAEWYNSLKVPTYEDRLPGRTYRKQFQKGSELEWYNPAYSIALNDVDDFNNGIHEMWISEENYREIFVSKSRDFIII